MLRWLSKKRACGRHREKKQDRRAKPTGAAASGSWRRRFTEKDLIEKAPKAPRAPCRGCPGGSPLPRMWRLAALQRQEHRQSSACLGEGVSFKDPEEQGYVLASALLQLIELACPTGHIIPKICSGNLEKQHALAAVLLVGDCVDIIRTSNCCPCVRTDAVKELPPYPACFGKAI